MRHLLLCVLLIFSIKPILSQTTANLFAYKKNAEKEAVVVMQQKIDDQTVMEKVVLEGYDSKVPFYYFTNSRKENPGYIILLHGLGDNKEDWVYPSEPWLDWSRNTTAIKDSLLSLGYNILIPDAKFHGERSHELGFRPPEMLPPVISRNEKDSRLFEALLSTTVKDIRIIMDYIQQRNATPEQAFGVIGYSLGGNLALLLSAFDDRVSSVVACVPPVNLPAKGLEIFDWSQEVIQGQKDITPMKYAQLLKSPTMLLMGKKDYYYTDEEVSEFFEGISTDKKELKYFNSGHVLPREYKTDAVGWITKHN